LQVSGFLGGGGGDEKIIKIQGKFSWVVIPLKHKNTCE